MQRPDPYGGVVAPDRGWKPREILSPAVARNAFASFHVAITVPPKESYFMYVLPNPVTACRVSVYREHFAKTAAGWIPDRLTELQRLPDYGVAPDPDDSVEDQNTRVYLIDLWIPPNADVARFRLEVQVKMADWIIRPMEVRIREARVPDAPAGPDRPLPAIDSAAVAPAMAEFGAWMGGRPLTMPPPGDTVRGILRRNAIQDLALAGDPALWAGRILDLFRANSAFRTPVWGAEWWLRIRDALLR